tara:strand:- start:8395 stop:9558 length:1164 start_codon:yes stop_codon:yes gene_type:complete
MKIKMENRCLIINNLRTISGGGIIHLLELTKFLSTYKDNKLKIKIYCHSSLKRKLEKRYNLSNIKVISNKFFDNTFFSLIIELFYFGFLYGFRKNTFVFNTDGASLYLFRNQTRLYTDLLAFEKIGYKTGYTEGIYSLLRLISIFLIQKFGLLISDKVVFHTNYSKKCITKGLPKFLLPKIKVIPHTTNICVSKEKDFSEEVNFNIADKKIIKLLYVSPFYEYKRQDEVIRAFYSLLDKGLNLELTLAGEKNTKYAEKLFKKVEKNKHFRKLKIYGALPHKKVLSLMQESDIFIFNSACESFGITLLEAAASYCHVVCSNSSALPEVSMNLNNIYLVDGSKTNEIEEKINWIIKNNPPLKRFNIDAFPSWEKAEDELISFTLDTKPN